MNIDYCYDCWHLEDRDQTLPFMAILASIVVSVESLIKYQIVQLDDDLIGPPPWLIPVGSV